ncbi:MAG: hypothetical protein AAB518_00805 [Patescibacteria group bacterium]
MIKNKKMFVPLAGVVIVMIAAFIIFRPSESEERAQLVPVGPLQPTESVVVPPPSSPLPVVTVTVTDGNAAEQGLNPGTFRLTRTGPTTSALGVLFSLTGTAVNGVDYQLISPPGTKYIPAGANSAIIRITPIDDAVIEPTETVTLTLTPYSTYAVGSPNSGVVNITDNDVATSGSYTVVDDSTPGYRIVTAGSAGVLLTRLKFSASNEDIDIRRVAFQLSDVFSNTPIDLVNQEVKLYDEANPTVVIATAQFAANSDLATSSVISSGTFRVPSNGFKVMLVKGDIAGISVNGPLASSGDLLKVDYDGNGGNYGVGAFSGGTIIPSSADTTVQGVRIMKSYPIFTKLSIPSNILVSGSGTTLYRFTVQALGGDVRIHKLTFNISSSTQSATTSKYSLYAYTDPSFSIPDTSISPTGLINVGQCYRNQNGQNVLNTVGLAGNSDIEIISTTGCHSGATTFKIPTGQSRYFDFAADVANVETGVGTEFIAVRVRGDSAFPTAQQAFGAMGSVALIDMDMNDDSIWSPVSTSTIPALTDLDFTNGYQVPGLPPNDMAAEILTSL